MPSDQVCERATKHRPTPKKARQKPATESSPVTNPITVVVESPPETLAATKRREEAEQREKEDLIAQQAMAWATDRIVVLTWAQIILGSAGALLLLFTLSASIRATKAAEKAASVADSTLTKLERPHDFLKFTDSGVSVDSFGRLSFSARRMKCEFVNYGRSPAIVIAFRDSFRVEEGMTALPAPIDSVADWGAGQPVGTVIGEKEPFQREYSLLVEIPGPEMLAAGAWQARRLFYQGFIRYQSVMRGSYILGFCAVFEPLSGSFRLVGDERYNYNRNETHPG